MKSETKITYDRSRKIGQIHTRSNTFLRRDETIAYFKAIDPAVSVIIIDSLRMLHLEDGEWKSSWMPFLTLVGIDQRRAA